MFWNQDLAMPLLPGAQANLNCPYFFSGMCGWHNGYSFCPVFTCGCKRNIEMTPLCKVEVAFPWVLGSREVRRGGVVDEQAGIQPS